jgi:hypothetical protein
MGRKKYAVNVIDCAQINPKLEFLGSRMGLVRSLVSIGVVPRWGDSTKERVIANVKGDIREAW